MKDPKTAEKLIPKFPFGSKRVPMETDYYETYNRENVHLVDIKEDPIDRIEPAEPIDKMDPFEPMLMIEPAEPTERDVACAMRAFSQPSRRRP